MSNRIRDTLLCIQCVRYNTEDVAVHKYGKLLKRTYCCLCTQLECVVQCSTFLLFNGHVAVSPSVSMYFPLSNSVEIFLRLKRIWVPSGSCWSPALQDRLASKDLVGLCVLLWISKSVRFEQKVEQLSLSNKFFRSTFGVNCRSLEMLPKSKSNERQEMPFAVRFLSAKKRKVWSLSTRSKFCVMRAFANI